MPAPRSETVKQNQQERADRLREVWERKRKDLGLVQKDVAKLLGWKTQGAVGHVLSGSTPLTIDLLLQMCEILEASPLEVVPEFGELLKFDDQYGQRKKTGSEIADVDLVRLGLCIKTIEEVASGEDLKLSEETKSKLIEFLYAELAGNNDQQEARNLAEKLVAIANSNT